MLWARNLCMCFKVKLLSVARPPAACIPGNHYFRVSVMIGLAIFSSLVSCKDAQRSSTAHCESWRREWLRLGGILHSP
ncbi:Uncharacterized protein HZ326_20035 [Fusarium oxysporum f. sp. albedinis]|nr:Uncharacterized protein HZ326_20035 [Fusarium oxysporum f. sp. albedinis]